MSSSSRRGTGGSKAVSAAQDGTIPSAIPFIQMNDKGQFFVHEQSVQLFSHIRGKICPIVVAGPYRTGKSTLLNLLLGQQVKSGASSGFQVGGTIQACTKGMWVWGQPIYNPETDCSYIFIDSEGLNSTDQTGTFDTQIFSLSILLSSLFILNTQGTINEQSLEQLELVLEMTKKVKVNESKSNSQSSQHDMQAVLNELSACFPSFLWVLRDFTLNLVDKTGSAITPTQYLESALVQQPVPSHLNEHKKQGLEEKNRVRQSISTLFRQRDCVTLIRPVVDERDLSSNISTLDSSKIRAEFVQQMAALRERVFQWAQPKQIDNLGADGKSSIALNAHAFVHLAKTYVDAMNTGTVPVIKSAFTAVRELSAKEALEHAYTYVTQHLQELDRLKSILDDAGLESLHAELTAQVKNIISSQSIGDALYKEEVITFFQKDKLQGIWNMFVDRNKDKSITTCRAVVQKIWSDLSLESKLSSYSSAAALEGDWAVVKREYLKHARGPASVQSTALNEFLEAKLAVVLRNLFDQADTLKSTLSSTQNALKQKEADERQLKKQLEDSQKQFEMIKYKLDMDIQQANKENQSLKQQLDKLTSDYVTLQQESTDIRVKMVERSSRANNLEIQLTNAQAEIERVRAAGMQVEAELSRIKVEGAARLKELEMGIKQAEKERIALEEEETKNKKKLTQLEKEHQKEKTNLLEKCQSLQSKYEALSSSSGQTERQHLAKFEALTNSYERKLAESHSEQEKLSTELKTLQTKLNKESEVAGRVLSIQEKLEELKSKSKHTAEENETLKKKLEAFAATENRMKAEIQLLQSQLSQPKPASAESVSKWGAPQPPNFAGAGVAATTPASTGRGRKSKPPVVPEAEPEYEVVEPMERFEDDDDDDEEEDVDDKKAPTGKSAARGGARGAAAKPASQAMSDEDDSVSEASESGSGSEEDEEEERPRPVKKRQSLIYRHLPDPSKETIQALKSWLTSLDVTLPVRAQPKAYYLDLLYEHQEGLETKWPRKATAAKKSKK